MTTPPTDSPEFALLQDIARELSVGEVIFPTFVEVTMRIRELVNDPNLSMNRIAKMVAGDPLLAARVVRLANAAAYKASSDTITDLGFAVTRIGLDTLRSLMYAIAISQLRVSKELARYQDISRKLWEHSLETAALAHVIAKKCSRIPPDKAMLAGLVHDIGAFYLFYRLAVAPHGIPDSQLISLVYQWHEEIGYAVLSALDQPQEIVEAVKSHDVPREITVIRHLADVVYLANLYAGLDTRWYADESVEYQHPAALELAGVSLNEIIEESRAEIEEIKAAFT